MKLIITIFFFFFLNILFCHGQSLESIISLDQKIQTADSIILISHEVTAEYQKMVPDWDSRDSSMNLKKWHKLHPPLLKFLLNGKLNRKIIKESVLLNESNKKELSNILLQGIGADNSNQIMCDMPRHSIIFYQKGRQSYIDICFGCEKIHTSKDIKYSALNMDESKWKELKLFFKSLGLTKVFKEYDE